MPVYENYYAFTIGNDMSSPTPEPGTLSLLGLGAIPMITRKLRKQ